MFTRKTTKRAFHPLTMALTVVILLAMLVPVAAAAPAAPEAPEWVHGVNITSPTAGSPVYIDPGNPDMDDFQVEFDLTIVGLQVDDVQIRIRVFDMNGWIYVDTYQYIVASNDLVEGVNPLTSEPVMFPWWMWSHGWYGLEVCARDADDGSQWFCDVEQKALLLDYDDPGVRLIKPAWGAWISGMDYLLVGKAWDPYWAEDNLLQRYGGIASTRFDYCVRSNWQGDFCGPDDLSWITIATGTPTPGVPDQYDAIWDSTKVPDDWGYIRFCAVDLVGREACDVHEVYVNNRHTVDLRPGWNLVSTPLMLYNDDMDSVLLHLVAKDTVKSVWWYNGGVWTKWTPGDASKFEHGQGYWIEMKAVDRLTFVGNWKNIGNQTPPEYAVATGWNLIGYTHWGQPTWWGDKTVYDYLEGPVASSMQALWRYDAWSETYIAMYNDDFMVKGAGYWLATARAGVIRP